MFLRCHIPYRLEFLRRGTALRSDAGVRDPAIVEAALMAGRQLIQFLGLDIDFEDGGRPRLATKDKKRYHYWKDRMKYTDEVRIVNSAVSLKSFPASIRPIR
jgi:hypothetical protein